MPQNIVFMRHTETERNAGHDAARKGDNRLFKKAIHTPTTETRLSRRGETQARKIGMNLRAAGWRPGIIITSGLARTGQVAELLGLDDVTIISDERMNERRHGVSDDMTHHEMFVYVKKHNLWRYKLDAYNFRFPGGGESYADVRARLRAPVRDICRLPQETVLVIGHSQTLRVIVHQILGSISDDDFARGLNRGSLAIENGECFHYRRRKRGPGFDLAHRWMPEREPNYGPNNGFAKAI